MKKIKLTEKSKKLIVLCSMVVMLVVAGTLNVVLNLNLANKNKDNNLTVSTFYTEQRTDRQAKRSEQIALLDAIINNPVSSETAVTNAEKQKFDLCANIEKELVIEGLIKAKGFKDAIVTMSTKNLNVFVDKAELTDDEVAKIFGIIQAETDYLATNIIIIPSQSIV